MARLGAEMWAPGEADRKAASELHTQLTSRVSTQPIGYSDGDEVTALESIFRLFEHARTAADRNFGASHFDALVWHVLNGHVRPFTAHWHRQSKLGRLAALDATDEFRAKLANLQEVLIKFDQLLLELRDGQQPPSAPKIIEDSPVVSEMAGEVRWGINEQLGNLDPEDARAINAAERKFIERRRTTYRFDPGKSHAAGLALSGGGIRSATFSLGVLVALSKRNLLQQFDYLSTVSGGGYLGAFLTTFLATEVTLPGAANIGLCSTQLPFRRTEGEAAALRHVRHRCRYLQTSAWERIVLASMQIYGMAFHFLAIATLPAIIALAEYQLRTRMPEGVGGLLLLLALTLLAIAFAVGVPLCVRYWAWSRKYADVILGCLFAALIALGFWKILGSLHWLVAGPMTASGRSVPGGTLLIAAAVIPLAASAAISLDAGHRPRLEVVLTAVASLAWPVFLLGIELAAYQWLSGGEHSQRLVSSRSFSLFLLLAAIVLLTHFCLDVNFTSPYRHYRKKLAETFLIQPAASAAPDRPFVTAVSVPLSECASNGRGPYPLFNCALNVPGSKDGRMQGRLTDFFLFSPAFCGSPLTGFKPTASWEEADPAVDVGTAMAASGAAASPLMGLGSRADLRFWLSMLNVRLGYWLRNPRIRPVRKRDAPGLRFLFKEMIGHLDEKDRYLNITDGGHIENLGVYELLRRRCKYIVAIDGEQDPEMTFHGFTNLQRLAAIDLGVQLDIDLDDLRLRHEGLTRSHFQFCRVFYPVTDGGRPEIGYLVYLKLSLTGNEGEFLRRYRLDEPDFPHHATSNQFFTEAQFEAYRALGEHVGDKLFLRAIVGSLADKNDVHVEDWFGALGKAMLRPR